MALKTLGAQVEEDSELYEEFEEYKEDNAMTNSEALRSLMRSGLEAQSSEGNDDPDRPPGVVNSLLFDAEKMKHDAVLIAAGFTIVWALLALPFALEAVALVPAGLYALTAALGFYEWARRKVAAGGTTDESSTADTREVKA